MGASTRASLTFEKSPAVKCGFVVTYKGDSQKKHTDNTRPLCGRCFKHQKKKADVSNSECFDYSGNSKINRLVNVIDNTRGCPQIQVESPRGRRLHNTFRLLSKCIGGSRHQHFSPHVNKQILELCDPALFHTHCFHTLIADN